MSQELLDYVPAAGLLQDRVILVTGAAMGIGRAAALAYARFGATVVLLDKQVAQLEKVYDEITAAGWPQPAIYPLDMQGANQDDYVALAENIREQLGRLDGLVLNAAWLAAFMPISQHAVDLWLKMITVNLHANFLLTRACLPLLDEAEDAAIVFSSDRSDKAYYGAFGVAKGGMNAFCDILAQEHDNERHFIRVNRIDTGPVLSSTRVLNFPGEHPDTLVHPEQVVGPYLFYMGPDAGRRTGEALALERIAPDYRWPGGRDGH
ncbi:MAG: SDR family NAD(P)-dependent oxidoreductase [Thiolinea sp.]